MESSWETCPHRGQSDSKEKFGLVSDPSQEHLSVHSHCLGGGGLCVATMLAHVHNNNKILNTFITLINHHLTYYWSGAAHLSSIAGIKTSLIALPFHLFGWGQMLCPARSDVISWWAAWCHEACKVIMSMMKDEGTSTVCLYSQVHWWSVFGGCWESSHSSE